MHSGHLFFAANFLRWIASKAGDSPTLVFFGSITVITVIVFGWAILSRNQQPHRRHHHSHHVEPTMDKTSDENEKRGWFSILGGHRHRRRKKHRNANPTLAETGGLPAARNHGQHPPAPPA
jgi:hypothetical protein